MHHRKQAVNSGIDCQAKPPNASQNNYPGGQEWPKACAFAESKNLMTAGIIFFVMLLIIYYPGLSDVSQFNMVEVGQGAALTNQGIQHPWALKLSAPNFQHVRRAPTSASHAFSLLIPCCFLASLAEVSLCLPANFATARLLKKRSHTQGAKLPATYPLIDSVLRAAGCLGCRPLCPCRNLFESKVFM